MKFIAIKIVFIFWKILSFIPKIILSVIYYPIARKISWKHLPQVAKKLGLNHIESKYYSEFGKLSGTIWGYHVIVEPDENAKIIVHFKSVKFIQLWTKKDRQKPSEAMPGFKTPDWKFNSIFKTRRANEKVAKTFITSTELSSLFIQFFIRWIWSLETIYVSDKAIYCEFNYGHPFYTYIPASVLEKLLKEIIYLVSQLDSII